MTNFQTKEIERCNALIKGYDDDIKNLTTEKNEIADKYAKMAAEAAKDCTDAIEYCKVQKAEWEKKLKTIQGSVKVETTVTEKPVFTTEKAEVTPVEGGDLFSEIVIEEPVEEDLPEDTEEEKEEAVEEEEEWVEDVEDEEVEEAGEVEEETNGSDDEEVEDEWPSEPEPWN